MQFFTIDLMDPLFFGLLLILGGMEMGLVLLMVVQLLVALLFLLTVLLLLLDALPLQYSGK